jgi:hypothetical protein
MEVTVRSSLPLLLLILAACDLAYPEVVIVNKTSEHIQLRDLSFNGCTWNEVLSYGEATAVGRCLPGTDRVHFEKFDAAAYCEEQAEDGTIPGVCPCDGGTTDAGSSDEQVNPVPTWFNYQTVSVKRAGYGEFHTYEVTLDDMEQDFSVPGPYGH